MKKKIQTYNKEFKMPHLFRNDLEIIESIIKNELKPQEYTLESIEFEYQSVQEIPKNTKPTNKFVIQTYQPYVAIKFNNYNAEIYTDDDNIKTVGAIQKIEKIILKRERIYCWMFRKSNLLPMLICIFFGLLLKLFLTLKGINSLISNLFSIIISLCLYFFIEFVAYRKNFYHFSLIEFSYKQETPNFFIRNKDQIILIIIGAICGTLITIFFQKIFH